MASAHKTSMPDAGSAITSHQQGDGENKGEGPTRAELSGWQVRSYRLERLQVIFSAVLSVTAVVSAIVGYGQWAATRDQYVVMIKQNMIMMAQQRPWISLDATVPVEPVAGYPLNLMFELKNSGPTPGTVVEEGSSIIYFRPDVEAPHVGRLTIRGIVREVVIYQEFMDGMLADGKVARPDFSVSPNGSVEYGMDKSRPLDETRLNEILKGKIVPVAVAFIRYNDPSGDTYTTWFCGVYNPKKREFTKTPKYNRME